VGNIGDGLNEAVTDTLARLDVYGEGLGTEEDSDDYPDDPVLMLEFLCQKDPELKELLFARYKEKTMELEEQKEGGFDVEKAKKMAEGGKTYLWEASPMRKYIFQKNDRIKFFSTSNKSETKAMVIDDLGERIRIKTENGNEVEINKKSVISSDMYDNSKSKKDKT
jgi:hypothetical protein